MWLLIPILILLILAATGIFLVRWAVVVPAYEETDDDDDTMWVEPQEWSLLERLFGRKPEKLTHRPPD